MVSWMAGMFYLVRIFVYHAEAQASDEPKRSILCTQFEGMEQRVYRLIMNPAIWLTWSGGCTMLFVQPVWLAQPWMQVKLLCLVLLTGYHHYCKGHLRKLMNGVGTFSHVQYRAMNEIPTLFLVTIVFLAVFKDQINFLYLILGVCIMAGLIIRAISRLTSKMAEN